MTERVTSVPLETGLYVLRYVQAPTSSGAPHVFVRPSPGSDDVVSVISPPGERQGLMPAPGACVVVRAERAGGLQVTIRSVAAAGGTEAELRLETLSGEVQSGGVAQSDVGRVAPAQPAPSLPVPRLDVLGHVSRRGDVRVVDDQWIAGPASPAPIEGLAIQLVGDAAGLSLEYQVQIGGPGGAWSPWMASGYAGTKGQARPLLGVRLRLVGARASQFQIEAEALFLGATAQRLKGQAIEALSGSGVDPMVGLKLLVIPAAPAVRAPIEAQRSAQQRLTATQPAAPVPAARAGRVRVFRSSGLR
ncbi:hypothetical protein MKK84_11200 [Methylobacterium sp. E-065]|uniref:hypothetical protein n=1 Tax=Methylobacterium sp. E-065 TaxID=2836583 RepID=UPI001FB8723B|nr:hypothetical protein [Methylobacterium sp. E-065]MCJ2017986.1 hypothetical protein [Methylobacterium sp. E-065]